MEQRDGCVCVCVCVCAGYANPSANPFGCKQQQ
eukprot:COSAG05_NODE_4902_length_1332_cov_1.386050_1_plen_32_part_10